MLLEGGSTKALGIGVGAASLALGLVEASTGSSGVMAPVNIGVGGILLVVIWVGHRLVRIADKFVEGLGSKLIALPSREELDERHATLMEKLEAFAAEAKEERRETNNFRRDLARELADHGARLSGVEDRLRGVEAHAHGAKG